MGLMNRALRHLRQRTRDRHPASVHAHDVDPDDPGGPPLPSLSTPRFTWTPSRSGVPHGEGRFYCAWCRWPYADADAAYHCGCGRCYNAPPGDDECGPGRCGGQDLSIDDGPPRLWISDLQGS